MKITIGRYSQDVEKGEHVMILKAGTQFDIEKINEMGIVHLGTNHEGDNYFGHQGVLSDAQKETQMVLDYQARIWVV